MKIKEIRKVIEEERPPVLSGCDGQDGDGSDKPPC